MRSSSEYLAHFQDRSEKVSGELALHMLLSLRSSSECLAHFQDRSEKVSGELALRMLLRKRCNYTQGRDFTTFRMLLFLKTEKHSTVVF